MSESLIRTGCWPSCSGCRPTPPSLPRLLGGLLAFSEPPPYLQQRNQLSLNHLNGSSFKKKVEFAFRSVGLSLSRTGSTDFGTLVATFFLTAAFLAVGVSVLRRGLGWVARWVALPVESSRVDSSRLLVSPPAKTWRTCRREIKCSWQVVPVFPVPLDPSYFNGIREIRVNITGSCFVCAVFADGGSCNLTHAVDVT